MQAQKPSDKPLRVIQFTDTHFFESDGGKLMGVDTAHTFEMVRDLAHRKHGSPDLYLMTGDLSQDETKCSYERLCRSVGEFQAPAYYLPGNHDNRPFMQDAFEATSAPFSAETVFKNGHWQFILLDTQVPNEVGGYLGPDQLQHLERSLQESARAHVFIALHHHVLPVGSAWMDTIKIGNAADFLSIIDRFANVRAVLCGHIHQEFQTKRKEVIFLGSPSTCVQFAPKSSGFALDDLPPGYRYLELFSDGTLKTEIGRLNSGAPGLDLQSSGY